MSMDVCTYEHVHMCMWIWPIGVCAYMYKCKSIYKVTCIHVYALVGCPNTVPPRQWNPQLLPIVKDVASAALGIIKVDNARKIS